MPAASAAAVTVTVNVAARPPFTVAARTRPGVRLGVRLIHGPSHESL